MASDSIISSKATINWDESWKELDLVFGIAINNDSSEVLLNPSDYGVTPHGGVQFADVALLGSDSANRLYASFDNYINAKGGNDILFSIDNYTGNQIVGGTGSDTFYLQATNNLILGGEIFENSESYALSDHVGLADFEADTYLIESSSKQVSLSQYLKIYDFEVNRDSLSIDGLKIEVSDWATTRNLLNSNNIDINATPESTLKRITISLLEGKTTNTDLAPYILDPDNDALRAIKINGPDWITLSGTVLTANSPAGITEDDLKAIDLQIGYTDEKVVSPFAAHLTLNNTPTALELVDVITSLDEKSDTSQPIKLADIVITDDALGSNIITLSGDDEAVFEVSGNALFLKAGTPLDFEAKSSYNINVNVADPDLTTSTPISAPFTLTLTDINEPPTALELTDVITSLDEKSDTTQPIKLADIVITDDALGSNIITLSGDDAAVFEVSGNALFLKAGTSLDFEAKSSYDIIINVADPDLTTSTPISAPFSFSLTRNVIINNINAAIRKTSEVANPNEIEALRKSGIELSPVAIDFDLDLDPGLNDSKTTIPLGLLLGDLKITLADGKRDPNKNLIYFSIDALGSISALSYDALQKGGARFYDSDGDGIPDLLSLKLVDGGIGDKDGVKNGVIDDPSVLGTVALDPMISQRDGGFIQVSDPVNTSPAAFALQATLSIRATTVTEIGYVILNDGENANVVDDLNTFKSRAKTLFSSLESDDIVLESTMRFEREFLLRNGQNIRFFAVSDGTLDDLSDLSDARLSFFDSSIDRFGGQASFSNANGITFDLSLLEGDQNLSALIAQEQTIAPLLDFTAFTNNETISGSIVQSREADYDAITGFYRVADTSGSVRADDGSLLTPGHADYAAVALREANQVKPFSNLSIADGQTSSTEFILQDSGTFAPFAQVNGNTFFAFTDANTDGLSHFRSLGTNLFGLEDQVGGGDLDYDDHILGFIITGLTQGFQ